MGFLFNADVRLQASFFKVWQIFPEFRKEKKIMENKDIFTKEPISGQPEIPALPGTSQESFASESSAAHRGPAPDEKFCKHCGSLIHKDCVICPKCGRQVEELQSAQPNVVINNSNNNVNTNNNSNMNGYYGPVGRMKNKWLALLLCFFVGFLGAHRFYEGKILSGILYFFTGGLMGLGVLADLVLILLKPNPYYV